MAVGALPNQLEPPDSVIAVLRQLLHDPSWSVHWSAVEALSGGQVPTEQLAAVLLESVPVSHHPGFWLAAARCLQSIPAELAQRVRELEAP